MDELDYERARAQARRLTGFYASLITYVVVNILLVVVNLVVSPGTLWFYWVTIFWGVGLAFHAFDVFVMHNRLNEDWEERKTREIIEQEQRRKTG